MTGKLFKGTNRIERDYGQWGFRRTNGTVHGGVDVDTLPGQDGTIYSVTNGYVYRATYQNDNVNMLGYQVGVYVNQTDAVKRVGTVRLLYGHNSKNLVAQGARVAVRQAIAIVGKTGNAAFDSQGEHVHLQADRWNGGAWVNIDPTPYTGIPNKQGSYAGFGNETEDTIMAMSTQPVKMWFGAMSGGDLNSFKSLLAEKQIPYTEAAGVLTTSVAVSKGDQVPLMQKAISLAVSYGPAAEQSGNCTELQKRIEELQEQAASLTAAKNKAEAEAAEAVGKIKVAIAALQ